MAANSLEFRSVPHVTYNRVFVFVVTAGFVVISAIFFPGMAIDLVESSGSQKDLWINLVGCLSVGAFLVYGGFFMLLPMALEFWKSHVIVVLGDAGVTARNTWRQEMQLYYDDIVAIRREPASILRGIASGLDLLAVNGQFIRLHPEIDQLGACVKAIESRCKNLKEIDYGGLDKKEKYWGTPTEL